ncbi:MAG: ATP-binding protein [Deltaproteobacteria bacterium]|nr:ATP-binding protein [Deltaproteobacteria bacterium]
MGKIIRRLIDLKLPEKQTAFLWGPRKAGKTYWIRHHLESIPIIDLLKTDVFAEYSSRPSLLRERYSDYKGLIVIDEVQKIPALLDEVHWLIENSSVNFLLTGSSARKLRRGHANLLGGRAWRRIMTPLSYKEVDKIDLEKIMVSGLLPPHFLSSNPIEDLRAYIADYLKEEIASEAVVRNIPAFSEFLRVASITSSELLNYANVGREAGVSSKVVRSYFDIMEDTYLGFRIPPWTRSKTRRMIETEKFYLFDVGVANFLAKRRPAIGSPEFGKSFEHYILMELKAYQAYRNPEMEITFWRTSSGQEVDFILGDKEIAIEIKASKRVHDVKDDMPAKRHIVISLEEEPRKILGWIDILPWQKFLDKLWNGELGV